MSFRVVFNKNIRKHCWYNLKRKDNHYYPGGSARTSANHMIYAIRCGIIQEITYLGGSKHDPIKINYSLECERERLIKKFNSQIIIAKKRAMKAIKETMEEDENER